MTNNCHLPENVEAAIIAGLALGGTCLTVGALGALLITITRLMSATRKRKERYMTTEKKTNCDALLENDRAIEEMKRSMRAIALELPGPVYDDFKAKFDAGLKAVEDNAMLHALAGHGLS